MRQPSNADLAAAIRAIADVVENEPDRVVSASLHKEAHDWRDGNESPIMHVVELVAKPPPLKDFTK